MKKMLFLFVVLCTLTSSTSPIIMIPNVEFNIHFLNHTTGTPTLSVNGVATASSTGPHYWTAFVDGPVYSGVFNFISNKCYSLKGIGGTQNLCITFSANYNPNKDQPLITYNVTTKTFSASGGANCTYKVSKYICCINKETISPK